MDSTAGQDRESGATPRKRVAMVVVDLVESVRLMQLHEDRVISRWRQFVFDVSSEVLPLHGGRLVKSLGDGMLLELAGVKEATALSFELHRRMAAVGHATAADESMQLRCGVHVADVVVDANDIYGAGVNLASRLAALAEPGQTVVSCEVRDEIVVGLDAELEDLGPCFVKHYAEPVRAFRLSPARANAQIREPAVAPRNEMRALIAVIPFEHKGAAASAEDTVIGEWIAEGCIVLLSKVAALRVVSRMSSSAVRGRQLGQAELSAQLGADYVLSGSYSGVGSKLLITAELADARRGEVVWADRVHGSVQDLLSPASETLSQLVAAVQEAVNAHETQQARLQAPPTLHSFSLLIGSVSMMHRSGKEDFERAATLLRHLVDRHPRLAAPRAWLAQWYVLRVTRGLVVNTEQEAAVALDQVRRALDSDPGCSLALTMKGFVQCHMLRDLDLAAATLDEAIAMNPSDSLAWLFKGVVHSFWGQGEPALQAVQEAARLSPLDPLRYYYDALSASAALAAGDYRRAAEFAERSLRVNRLHSPTWRALVIAQSELGEMQNAASSLARLLALESGLTVQSYLSRSPAGADQTRKRFADALQRAGLPTH